LIDIDRFDSVFEMDVEEKSNSRVYLSQHDEVAETRRDEAHLGTTHDQVCPVAHAVGHAQY
jgi:hypothetical protein